MNEKLALLQSISAYVPGFIAGQVIADPYTSLAGREERMDAAVLFADVSGFTAMSESLARMGKEGAEELTRVLNDYFTTMIDLVQNYGGQVTKFGGDAITCAFVSQRAGESVNARMELWRACACALAMQEKMAEFRAVETRGGVFELRMKIGISKGPVLFLSVGDPQKGLEYVLAGRPLDRMAEAEHHAAAGEVMVDGECIRGDWKELGIIVGEGREGFLLMRQGDKETERQGEKSRDFSLSPPLPLSLSQEIDWSVLDEESAEQAIAQLTPYLPPTIYERIVEGQEQFLGEQRRVVSLFVNFFGLDYDADPRAGQKLQRYFTAMQEIIHRYGGRLNRVITGDKGNLLHLIFGAPVTREDNEARAVGCALAMQRRAVESDELSFIADQRIGVASGPVFAGNVGSKRRREYTVMGDVVNLSARLMQAAGMGEILLEQRTARQVEKEFICEELAPITVKGKREPVSVSRAVGVRTEAKVWGSEEARARRRESPIVGRKGELARTAEVIERAAAGRGQLLAISGEAGVGKSRLLEEVIALAREKACPERRPEHVEGLGRRGMYGLGGDCLSHGSQSPYLPWIDFFNAFFGLSEEEKYAQKMRRIEQRMAEADPALEDWAPLMGQLLGLPAPDNELTGSLDAQLRKQRTFDITLNLLRHQAQHVPLFLIVFEDTHWIDAISLEMLNHVARNIADYRILLVALYRPTIEMEEWRRYDYYNRIELVDLAAKDALKLVQFKLGLERVPGPLQEQVLRGESRVNPFFVEEVLNSLVDRGYLAPKAEGKGYALAGDLTQVEIPDSIQALVMSRIDRLDESSKLTVKVASVIGRTFKYQTLGWIYPVKIAAEKLLDNLERLNSLDLTPLDRPEPEWEYIFKHVTTQEVAYESLLYAQRRTLHHRVGEYLEQAYADSVEEYYELLAHHYYQSEDREKSWDYLIQAGDKAREKYANEAAIAHYTQVLSMDVDREDVHLVYESLGDVYRLIGQYEQALENYQEALEHHPTITRVAEMQRKIAKTWELQGQYDKAVHYLNQARTALGEKREIPELARIYSDMGWLAMRRGNYEEALQLCAQGLNVVKNLPYDEKSHRVKAMLQYTLGTTYQRRGNYPQAILHFQTYIEMQESIGDLPRISGAYNNLASVYWSQSDYDLAAQYLRKSLEISQKIGDTYGTAMCYNNLGVVSYTLEDYPHAIEHYKKSLEIRREIGDSKGIADVYGNLGEVHHSLENYQQALHYLQEAVELFTEIGDKRALSNGYKLLAEVELKLGDTNEALVHCQQSLELAQEIGNREYEGVAYRVLGQIHRAADRPEEARQHLQTSVEILSAVGSKLELGKSYYELGITLSAMGLDARRAGRERLQDAVRMFEELGVEGELEKARAAMRQLTMNNEQ